MHEDNTDAQKRNMHKQHQQQQRSSFNTPTPEVNKSWKRKWKGKNWLKPPHIDNKKQLWPEIIQQLQNFLVIEDQYQGLHLRVIILTSSQLKLNIVEQYWKIWSQYRRAYMPDLSHFSQYDSLISWCLTNTWIFSSDIRTVQ